MNTIAKKVFALGSAAVMALSALAMPLAAVAAVHAVGTNVKTADGTVWMIMSGNCRRAYTSAGAFLSYGFNSFSQVVDASAEDLALPVCAEGFIPPQDGQIIVADRGDEINTAFFISGGQKRGFVSRAVYDGSGFPGSRLFGSAAVRADVSWMVKGANIDNAAAAHLPGALVNKDGTILLTVSNGTLGIPDLNTFASWGYSFNNTVMANAADRAMVMVGVMATRQPGQLSPTALVGPPPPPPSGPISASLASDNPASGTLVTGQSAAHLAKFRLSGTGTVTAVSLKRIGVSADSTLSNVYLFNGATRITDAASVSSSMVNFAGLNLAVNGSLDLSVRSDIATGTSGQTVGVSLESVTLSSGSASGTPIAGNVHTIASATLSGVALGTALPSSTATTDPGNDVRIWENTFTVTTRDVTFSRMALRQINSIQSADIRNFRLLVDGAQVAQVQNLDANGYVTFSGFSKLLTTGSRNVKVLADVVGGSSRIIQMSLRNKADLDVMDSQYNVNVSATGTFPSTTATLTVNSGTMSVQKSAASPSGNVTKDASDQVLGEWTFTAYGEPIKVETLNVAVDHNLTDSEYTLRNGKIMVNGSQVGSTTPLVLAGAAASAASFTTNFTVNPGTSATVQLRSDIYDEEDAGAELVATDTLQATLLTGSSNATRQISLGTVNVPSSDIAANQLTVQTGTMTLAAATNYTSHQITAPKTQYKVGSWSLSGGTTEDVNVHTLSLDVDQTAGGVDFDHNNLTDCKIVYGSANTTVKSSMVAADNDWSVSFVLAKNQVLNLDLFCNIASTTADGAVDTSDAIRTDLSVTGTGAQSSVSVSQLDKNGQTLTIGTGSLTEAIGASNPTTFITEDNVTKPVAAFKWTAANEAYTITEIVFDMNAVTTVQNLILKDGATVLATRPASTTDVTFGGLAVPVGVGETKELTVEAQLGAVGTGAGTMREDIKVTLDSYRKSDSQGVSTQDVDDVAGNSVFVFKAIPTVTLSSVTTTNPSNSELEVYKFTVAATGDPIGVKQFGFKVTITDNVGTNTTEALGDWKLFRDGTDITDQVQMVSQAGVNAETGGTALAEADTHLYVTFGSLSSDTFIGEEVVNTSRTYTLRATPSGFTTPADDDSFKVEMLSDVSESDTYLNDADATNNEFVGNLSAADGTSQLALPIFLLWSDLSAVPHNGTLDDDEAGDVASISSADWTNGYLVKNLPMSAQNFVF